MKFPYIFLFGILLQGQPQIGKEMNFSAVHHVQKPLGFSDVNIYYHYQFIKDSTAIDQKTTTLLLQHHSELSKLMDVHSIALDSLFYLLSKKNTVNTTDVNQTLAVRSKIKYNSIVLKDLTQKKSTTYTKLLTWNYQYTEEIPFFVWLLHPEQKQLLNYRVEKASTFYKGRKWTAWYSNEIPINNGPYLFQGLPGLILELYDDRGHFHFITKAIDFSPQQMYLKEQKRLIHLKKSDFLSTERTFHESPHYFHESTKVYSSPGVEINLPPQSSPYNPIELP